MHHPTDRIPHTTAFVTPVVEHWLEREIKKKKIVYPRSLYWGGENNNNNNSIIAKKVL